MFCECSNLKVNEVNDLKPHRLFDPIRKKDVPATPEEHVRQATVRYLLDVVKVPAHLIAVEFPLSLVGCGNG